MSDVERLSNVVREVPGPKNAGIWWLPLWLPVIIYQANIICTVLEQLIQRNILSMCFVQTIKMRLYCAFQKHATSCELSPSQQLRFPHSSII